MRDNSHPTAGSADRPANATDANRSADPGRAQVRGSTILLGGQAFAVVVNLAAQVIIVRTLTKSEFAAFAYALSIAMMGEAAATFGLRRGVSRFLPMYEERADRRRAAGVLVLAVGIVSSIGLAVVVLGVGFSAMLSAPIDDYPSAALLLAILVLLAPIQALESLLDGVFAAFTRPKLILLRRFVYTPVMRLVVVSLLALSASGPEFVAVGYVVTGVIGLTLYTSLLVRVLRERKLLASIRRPLLPARELLGFTVPLLSNDLVGVLLNAGTVVLIGVLATTDDVASFRAVLPVSLTLTYVLSSFGTLFVPLTARLYTRGQTSEMSDLYWQTAAWTAVLAFPVFAISFAFARPLVEFLFGPAYADASAVLAVLVVGHFVSAAVGPNGSLLAVHGRLRYIVVTNLAASVLLLALMPLLVPKFGALGGAIAASTTVIFLNGVRQFGLRSRTGIRGADRSVLLLYVLLASAAAMLVVLELLFRPHLVVAVAVVAVATVMIVAHSRRTLRVHTTFPELASVPLLRLLWKPPGRTS